MGATVVTDKAVRFLWKTPAEPIFFLYEETYEKNVHPHRPEWICVGVLRALDALPELFHWAGVCEGGMLQTRKGHTTPEAYLRSWKKAFAFAYPYQGSTTFRLDRTLRGALWDGEPPELQAQQVPALGLDKLAAWNAGVALEFTLPEDYEAFSQLMRQGQIARYKVLGSRPGPEDGLAEDFSQRVFRKKAPAQEMPVPKFAKLAAELRDEHLYEVQGSLLRKRGWPYSVVGSFVAQYAATELAEPGHFEQRLASFRQAVRDAQELSLATRVQVESSTDASKYEDENSRKLAERFPQGFSLSELAEADDATRSSFYFSGDLRLLD
jgi:hypothetical protein